MEENREEPLNSVYLAAGPRYGPKQGGGLWKKVEWRLKILKFHTNSGTTGLNPAEHVNGGQVYYAEKQKSIQI